MGRDSTEVFMITGGRALIDCLRREGVKHVFGIPGTQNLGVIDALRDATEDVRFVLTRHEQAAAFMAHGFGRASGIPGVVTATEGPGVTNLATGIGAAFKGFVPLISVTGTQEEAIRERDTSQEIDQLSFMRPITKWAYAIPTASKVQEAMRKAFRVALADPYGPVHVEASRDVWIGETESEPWEPASYRTMARPDCSPAQLDQAWRLIAEAERPVFLVGAGVLHERAGEALVRLADQTGIPVAMLAYAIDTFPSAHPLALGPLGRNGWPSANQAVPKADLVVVIGGRLDIFSTSYRYGTISPTARIVQHAAAGGQAGVVLPSALPLTGSTTSFIEGLIDRAARAGVRKEWLDVARVRAESDAERKAQVRDDVKPILPPFVAHTIRKVLPQNGAIIVDAGNAAKHMRLQFESYVPVSFMYSDDWGSVGCGFPIGMGVKLACPDRPVLCVEGDMGMMCNIGELETAVRERIPVVCVVFNDQGLGNERAFQQLLYGGRLFGVDYQNPDFGALARVFGAHGEQVREPGDLEGALRRALDSGKPAVLDVHIDQETLAPVAH
jgi:thiamine pyrophosphate-dependent acetolactate synthase large subunit-like protein